MNDTTEWKPSPTGETRKEYPSGQYALVRPGITHVGTFTGMLFNNDRSQTLKRGKFENREAAQKWADDKDALGEQAWL